MQTPCGCVVTGYRLWILPLRGTTGGTLRLVRCWFYCRVCVLHRGWRWWKERSCLAWGEPKFSLKADEGSDYALDPLNNQNGLYYNTKLYSPRNSLHIILNCLPTTYILYYLQNKSVSPLTCQNHSTSRSGRSSGSWWTLPAGIR